jgi:hypothetical protein
MKVSKLLIAILLFNMCISELHIYLDMPNKHDWDTKHRLCRLANPTFNGPINKGHMIECGLTDSVDSLDVGCISTNINPETYEVFTHFLSDTCANKYVYELVILSPQASDDFSIKLFDGQLFCLNNEEFYDRYAITTLVSKSEYGKLGELVDGFNSYDAPFGDGHYSILQGDEEPEESEVGRKLKKRSSKRQIK